MDGVIQFGDIEVDIRSLEVRRGGEPVGVEPQVFDVLHHLMAHRDRVVTKEELLDTVWGDRFVSESALTSRIKSVRRTVGDDGRRQEVIRTVHGRGYQFVAQLSEASPVETQVVDPGPSVGSANALRLLLGREAELGDLDLLVSRGRLVTVLGPGGVGKTRLAMEFANRWERSRDGEVFFVPLSPIADAREVPSAITAALGVGSDRPADALATALEALRGRQTLIVVDNFEHVMEAVPDLAELLEVAAGTTLVVTSRERLRLRDEQTLQLHPLRIVAAPGSDGSGPDSSPAEELFEQAASVADIRFRLSPSNADDVQAICSLLDGLPLGIELAAAQLRYVPLRYLRSHLESNLGGIGDPAHDRPTRHHSLNDTVAWSAEFLTPEERALFEQLSVFVGGWSPEGAAALDADLDVVTVMPLLAGLADKSLIRRVDDRGDEPRFSMLHLIREFASLSLSASPAEADAHRSHALYVAEFVEEATAWDGPSHGWVDDISSEYSNILAGLEWAFDNGDPDLGCRIVAGLEYWWFRSGNHSTGREWSAEALRYVDTQPAVIAARLQLAAARLAFAAQDAEGAREHLWAALASADKADDPQWKALVLVNMGLPAIGETDAFDDAVGYVNEGIDAAREQALMATLAQGLNVRGELMRLEGHHERARADYSESLELNRALGDKYYEAINLANLGHVERAEGHDEEALKFARAGLELSWRLRSRLMTCWSVSEIGGYMAMLGESDVGAKLIGGADAAMESFGVQLAPGDRPNHELALGILRGAVGADRYQELHAVGSELNLEQCVELALQALAGQEASR